MEAGHSASALPFVPRPFPDEILSSWLSRVGCHYDLGPTEILHRLDPHHSIESPREIDWRMSEGHVHCLAGAARISATEVFRHDAATVHPRWAPYWFSLNTWGHDPWNDRDLYGHELRWAWCDLCMASQYARTGHQYIRLPWTLACIGYCAEHRRMLTDRCSCGATVRPVHVAEGARTRLICRFCSRSIAQNIVVETRGPTRLQHAIDLQIAFERDLVAALDGSRPPAKWCGRASAGQLVALVDDVAHAICTHWSHLCSAPVERFSLDYRRADRFPEIPGLEHKLCALPSFWRANGIAAILSIIGDRRLCRIMSTDLDCATTAPARQLLSWTGSLEWMLSLLEPLDIRRLIERSSRWPIGPRRRLHAWIAEARASRR